jgi:hypothetical protein
MSRSVVLVIFCCFASPAFAQSPNIPVPGPESTKKASLVNGRISTKAPRCAQGCMDFLKASAKSSAEFFADEKGGLSVHRGISAKRLRFLAKGLEKLEGIRQALTDTPRRMILIIFDAAPAGTTPGLIAGSLEQMRRRYKESKKARAAPLGGPGNPGNDEGNPPKTERKPTKTEKSGKTPKIGEKKERNDRKPIKKPAVSEKPTKKPGKRSFSSNPTPITDEIVVKTKITGEITSARALSLWLKAKDRPQAVAIARKVLTKHPKDTRAGAVLAMYHLHQGHKMKAYRNMRTVIHYQPENATYRLMYAEVLYAMKMGRVAKEQEAKARRLGAK